MAKISLDDQSTYFLSSTHRYLNDRPTYQTPFMPPRSHPEFTISSFGSCVHEHHERRPAGVSGGISGGDVAGRRGSDHFAGAEDLGHHRLFLVARLKLLDRRPRHVVLETVRRNVGVGTRGAPFRWGDDGQVSEKKKYFLHFCCKGW